jgi:hypothetical protein
MIIDTGNMDTIIAFLITIIAALIAWYQNRQKNQIVQAFIPGTVESITPAIIATLPERSWKMSDSTKHWCTVDATPANKETILKAIDQAESAKLTHYTIHFDGGYYIIDYGLLMGGGGNPSGMKTN